VKPKHSDRNLLAHAYQFLKSNEYVWSDDFEAIRPFLAGILHIESLSIYPKKDAIRIADAILADEFDISS